MLTSTPGQLVQSRGYGSGVSEAIYSIGAVARMLGVQVGTLRTWEERYGVVVAGRSEGGQRRYSRDQLADLQFIVAEIDSGSSPGDAHRLLGERDSADTLLSVAAGVSHNSGPLVMIADRDPHAVRIVDYFMRTEGYQVVVARDAIEAERLLLSSSPDVVVVDLALSGGLGGAFFNELTRGEVRFVVMSSLAAQEVAAGLGADAFMQKPVDPLALVSAVRDLLGTSALTLGAHPGVAG